MNSVELKNHLLDMMIKALESPNFKLQNIHSCFYMAVIDCIIRQYMTISDYMEENAIETFKGFLESGVIVW